MVAPHPTRRHSLARRHDRRRHYRVSVSLLGRFMLEDRREFPCQTLNLSPGSVAVTTPIVIPVGERVVLYLDQVGRIEGHVSRAFEGGFAMIIESTVHKKDKLAAKLTWLANRHELNLPEDRRHERIHPETTVTPTIILPDGREYQATLVDVSLSGAAIILAVGPPTGSPLQIGHLRATVVRQLEHGVAVEFSTLQTLLSLKEAGLL
jgi:c-di-GMP-binding flagellar brake protein YcgR